nr:hypothetical protein [Tanacetum cinerariifolium]
MTGKCSKNHNLRFNSTSAHGNAAGMNPNKAANGVVGGSGVPLNTLGDIDNHTKAIAMGKLKVWSNLTSEKHTEVMNTIWAMWDAFLTENPNTTSGYSSNSGKSDVGIGESLTSVEGVAAFFGVPLKKQTTHDGWNALLKLESAGLGNPMITVPSVVSPSEPIVKTINTDDNSDSIVQSFDINTMPTSYARATGANNKDQPKFMSNFHHLVAYPVFNGVDIFIPRKVVKKGNIAPKKPSVLNMNEGRLDVINVRYLVMFMINALKRYKPKASTSTLMKVTFSHQDNITSSNSSPTLNVEDEEEEEVENVYDETANLFNTKTGGRSSFTAVVG